MDTRHNVGRHQGRVVPLYLRESATYAVFAAPAHSRFWQILLQKSFSTADQNFSRPLMRSADKYVRDLVSS